MPSLSLPFDLHAFLLIVAANSAPVVIAKLLGKRWAAPIDAGFLLPDGHPLLGSHKTWRGLIAGTLVAGLLGELIGANFATGALFGALALTGDLFSSLLKRRFNRASGRWTPLLDQLPEALLPKLVLQDILGLTASSIAGTAVMFSVLDLIISKRTSGMLAKHGAGTRHGC